MDDRVTLNDITIRMELMPGDLGYVVHRHGALYAVEYGYGVEFESYVAAGLHEFQTRYDPTRDRVWICEHAGRFVGCLFLMHRDDNAAQLRYFLVEPEYRGIGLGKKLMTLYMDFLIASHYASSYLWTTDHLAAAASLYCRFGFVLTAEKPSIAFGKPVTEQRYDLHLASAAP
jgi:peptidyl-dipeptidase Dcp